jgi:hypothetical protein
MKHHSSNCARIIILVIALAAASAHAGDLSFVPHGLLFRPLTANTFEPKVGFTVQSGENKLDLDIGNSIDLVQYTTDSIAVSFGADFFTYTFLRGESNFHFPVDASDYLFGFNINVFKDHPTGTVAARLRLSHISAHFVDGHYDGTNQMWKDNENPHVYSREFLDFTLAVEPSLLKRNLRAYVGAMYLFHVDPRGLSRWSATVGGEYHNEVTGNINLYAAYQANYMNVIEASTRHDIQAGVKLGPWAGRGVKFFASYFNGYNIHGEYFDQKEKYTGFGMNIDF